MDFRQRVSTLREFVRRHRLATTIATPVALGVVVVVVVAALLFATPNAQPQLTASVTTCHDMVTIAVAGRNDSPSATTTKMLVGADGKPLPAATSDDYHSTWEDPVINAPASKVAAGSYAAMYISYPANMSTFNDAVNAGVANTEKVMEAIRQACPNTQFAIVGYSEGSSVARQVAQQIGDQKPATGGAYAIVDPSKVTGVVILADNGRAAGDGPFPGAQQPFAHPDNFDQNYQTGTTPTPGRGALPDTSGGFGALNGRVASFCSDGDLTCAAPQNISLLQLAANVGRQINVDDLQNKGLTPATGADVAVTLAKIGFNAFEYIRSQPNWMESKQTFLDVLLTVSAPNYKPGQEQPQQQPGQQPSGQQQPGQQQPGQQPDQQQPGQQPGQQLPGRQQPGQQPNQAVAQTISSDDLSSLAYLPQKFFNEIIGLIVTNQNTIPVILSNPYQLTLGPNGTGHHFDYWRDSNSADGKPLTSAEYAAAWLVNLAQQAQAGKKVNTAVQPQQADVNAAYQAGVDVKTNEAQVAKLTTPATPVATISPTTTTAAPTTTTTSPTTTTTSPTTTTTSPTTTTTSPTTTTTSPTTTTTEGSASTTTTSSATSTTATHAAATSTSTSAAHPASENQSTGTTTNSPADPTSANPSVAHPASENQSTGTTTNSPADPTAAKPVASDPGSPTSTPSTSATAAKSVAVLPTTTDHSQTPSATTTLASPTTESTGGN